MTKLGKNGLSGTSDSLINSVSSTAPLEIICDGDSWVFGCEILDPELSKLYPDSTHPGEHDFEEANDEYRRPKIFSTHLSKIFNANVVNLSWPADDNGTILRRTMDYITNKYIANHLPTTNLFVIIGWSSPERNSFWYRDENINMHFRLWPNVPHFDAKPQQKFWELYVAHLWNPEEYIPRYVFNVVQFQNFCRAHGIKWLCFNSFYQVPQKNVADWVDLDIREELGKLKQKLNGYQYQQTSNPHTRDTALIDYTALWDTVDPVRFYKKDQPNNTFKSYISDPANNVAEPFNGWHPSPSGHEAWAHELARYIRSHNLL